VSDASAAEGLLTDLNPTGEGWIDVRVIGPGGKVLRREFLTARRPDEAAARALELREEGEVLFGVVARLEQRGTKDAVAGVRVAWLDVDDDDAVAALDDSPFKPTCVLNSGGGRHAYYLLEDAALPYRVAGWLQPLAAIRERRTSAIACGCRAPSTTSTTRPARSNSLSRTVPLTPSRDSSGSSRRILRRGLATPEALPQARLPGRFRASTVSVARMMGRAARR
jgi:hypothetical protein